MKNILIAFLSLSAILSVYFPWFNIKKSLSSGDWPYLFLQNIQAFKIPTEPPFLWLEPYYQITAKLGVQVFSLSWEATEKFFWFFPFLAVSLISSYFFLKYLSRQFEIYSKNSAIFISLGSLVFTTNTYILMLVGGGQMGVAMAYSLTPAVLQRIFTIINNSKFSKKDFILSSLILGIQLMFDPRIFLLSMLIVFLYILFTFKDFNVKIFKRILLVLSLMVIMNLFWILPNVSYFNTEYKSAIDAANANFLSFATFSNSISLLHPNWPENIFGKIGFMKPEFIILPILVFSAVLFVNKNKIILFFAFLGLLGAFFAKGTNPPLGELYEWLSNFPGFSIFRDPTKFYVLVAISYMVLLPLSIHRFINWLKLKIKKQNSKLQRKVAWQQRCFTQFKIQNYGSILFFLLFLTYWLFLIKPAIFEQLTGTFRSHDVPREYIFFRDFLVAQPESTKTLWVPSVERFGYSSETKPAISAMEIFGVSLVSGVLDKFDESEGRQQLIDEEVKYIIIPYDYLKEIFLTERQYDNSLYSMSINKLRSIDWLYEIENNKFGKIRVFEMTKL